MSLNYALISVYNKKGINEFAAEIAKLTKGIISSGGTATELKKNGINVIDSSEITGFTELLGGRVKTLHPKIHAGILADRKNKNHIEEIEKNGINQIDIVVVNLYPFEQNISSNKEDRQMVELIDIGGPTLIRAAAKNYENVLVVVDPEDYTKVIEAIKKGEEDKIRKELALKAWEHISHYDVVIENYFRKNLGGVEYPDYLNISLSKKQDLRYGENPHQTAAYYFSEDSLITKAKQLQGKELSYNNMLDADSALKILFEFNEPTAVIVKHNNPCGVASNSSIITAYERARATNPEAAFGGIVAINEIVEKELAEIIVQKFVEIVVAPKFSDDSIKILTRKKNLRLLEIGEKPEKNSRIYREYRSIQGGVLVQQSDSKLLERFEVVTKRKPTENEEENLMYAWKVAKYVKSNAIVLAKNKQLLASGLGQTSRTPCRI